jgi:hypothetical protein
VVIVAVAVTVTRLTVGGKSVVVIGVWLVVVLGPTVSVEELFSILLEGVAEVLAKGLLVAVSEVRRAVVVTT